MVRRSYDHETTKSGREEAVPIAAALVPHLEAALGSTPGELLFTRGAFEQLESRLTKD